MKDLFDSVKFGKAIKDHRIALHCCDHCRNCWTVRDVAEELGISIATISRIENGKPPSIETFARLMTWMGGDAGMWI